MVDANRELAPLGIWPGTYDMPTFSHKYNLVDALQYVDLLYVVPCGRQEGKTPVARPWERVAMVGLMVAELLQDESLAAEGRVRVWTGEVENSLKVSKTIETVEAIEAITGLLGQTIVFLGEDLVEGFLTWDRSGEMLTGGRRVLVHRRKNCSGTVLRDGMEWMEGVARDGGSRVARELIQNGKDAAHIVPLPTLDLIKQGRLYGYAGVQA